MTYKLNGTYSTDIQKKDGLIFGVLSNGKETKEIPLAIVTIIKTLQEGEKDIDAIVKARIENGVVGSRFTADGQEAPDFCQNLLSETQMYLDELVEDGILISETP